MTPALELAGNQWKAGQSPLARVWLSIALQTWDRSLPAPDESAPIGNDIMLTALQAIAHPRGNHALLRTEDPA